MSTPLISHRVPLHRVSLQRLGGGRLLDAFEGRFDAWSFAPITEERWFSGFREYLLKSIGRVFVPVYRIADGEFQFLLGRRVRCNGPHVRDCLAVAAERLGLFHAATHTSWGEGYDRRLMRALREELTNNIRIIASQGYLAVLISDNNLGLAHEYRYPFCDFVVAERIPFHFANYFPFHFVCEMLSNVGWEDFLRRRRLLIVTGVDDRRARVIQRNLLNLGVSEVQFLRVSSTKSMLDKIDCSTMRLPVDLCLVAAGVGAANILVQLQELNTVALDIGGFLHCFEDTTFISHAIFHAPAVGQSL